MSVRILLLSGSTRDRSTNTAALRSLAALAPAASTAWSTTAYAGTLPGGTQWTGLPTGWITVAAPGRGEGADDR